MLPNPWVIIGAIGFWLVTMGGGMLLAYNRGGDDNEAAHVAQDLAETKEVLIGLVAAGKEMNGLATTFTGISQTLSTEIDAISGKFRNGARANPLPATCLPDPFRVQSLASAIAATNSAIGRGASPAVPPAQ
jgi:hypothetical protein